MEEELQKALVEDGGVIPTALKNHLLKNPFAQFDEQSTPMIPTGTLQIYQGIHDYLEERNSTNVARASSANMCIKRRWFQRRGEKSDPLTPRKLVNFMLGDLSERTLLYFIKRGCVGPGKLYSDVDFGESLGSITFQEKQIELYKQKTMSFKIGDLTITGHADGFGRRNVDGKWELIECKSAADYGFREFQGNGPGDYLKQSHALMMMDEAEQRNIKSVRFFYLRKSTGHLWDRLHEWSDELGEDVMRDYIRANKDDEPEAPYDFVEERSRGKPTGRWTVPWQCGYCGFRNKCKPGGKLEWKPDQFGNNKPAFIYERNETCHSKKNQPGQVEAPSF